ncbi:MAG: hypothetical protein KBC69_00320 [Candidatus Magasanikbacteria bacterium]|nr:hypothetical protein [Candidatus Magasanikbacteria bacterium]
MARSKEEGAPKPKEAAKEKSKFAEKTKKRLDKLQKEKIDVLSDETRRSYFLQKITEILSSLEKESFEKAEQDAVNDIVKDLENEVRAVVTTEGKSKKTSEKEKKPEISPERLSKIEKLKSDFAEARAELKKKGILKTSVDTLKNLDFRIRGLSAKKEEDDFIAEHDAVSTGIAALMFLEAKKEDASSAAKVDQRVEEELSKKMADARKDITVFFDNLTNLEGNHSRSVKWVVEFGESFVELQEKAKVLEKLLREKKYDEFDIAIAEFNNFQDVAYNKVVKSEREYFVGLDKNKFKTILSVIKDRMPAIKADSALLALKAELEKSWATLNTKPEDQESGVFNQNIEVFQKNLEAFLAAAPADVRQEYEERLIGKVTIPEKKAAPASKDPVVTAAVDMDAENKRDQKIWKDADKKWRLLRNIFDKIPVAKRFSGDRFVSDRMDIIETTLGEAYTAPSPRFFVEEMSRFNLAFDLLLAKLQREAPEMKVEFEAQLAGAAPSWEKSASAKKPDTAKTVTVDRTDDEKNILAEARHNFDRVKKMINLTISPLRIDLLKNDIPPADILQCLELAEKAKDAADFKNNISRFDALLKKLRTRAFLSDAEIDDSALAKETAELEDNLKKTEARFNSFLDVLNAEDTEALRKVSSEVGVVKKAIADAKNDVSAFTVSQVSRSLWNLLDKAGKRSAKDIVGIYHEKIGFKVKAPEVTTPPDPSAEENKKKETERRKQEVEGHKLDFNRFLIDIAEDGLKEDIKNINEILEEASKNVHDGSVYDAHIDDYKKKIESLIAKAGELSKKTVHVEAKDSGGTPEQKYRLSIYNQDYGLLIGIIDDRNDPDLEQRLSKSVLEVENSFVAAEEQLNDQTLTAAYEKLRDFIDIVYIDPDRTIYQEFRQRLSDIHYPHAGANMPPQPQPHVFSGPPKKGFWTKAKEFGKGLFSKEGAKAVATAGYNFATSVVGVKIVTDFLIGKAFGIGDQAQRSREKKQAELSKENIRTAYYNLLRSFEIAERGLDLNENEQVPKRMAELRASIESSKLPPEAQEQIWQRLEFIYTKHQVNTDKAKEERREEVARLLDGYLHSKIEGVRIAKDALNLALAGTPFTALRVIMFAGTSLLERARKSSREYARQTSGMVGAKSETAFMAKDVFANSAIETARALIGMGAKKNSSGITRAVDFIKVLGTVSTAFGMYNLVETGGNTQQGITNIIEGVREHGWKSIPESIPHNLVNNFSRGLHTVFHPTEGVERAWDKVTGQEANQSLGTAFEDRGTQTLDQENSSLIDPSDLVSRPDVLPSDPIYAFAAEHGLSQESYSYLHQFPALANHPESLNRILESSHVGADVKSHFTGSKIDNLIEAGGERKAVIFEELVKADKAAAIAFLQNQDFSSRHAAYLSEFAGKDGKIDYQKFVENYNPENKKMSLALFRAMQGKENTELANGGLVRAATEDREGRTIRVKGDVIYLGLDKNGKPILSGDGEVQVRETLLKIEGGAQNVKVENLQQGAVFTNDEKLNSNANELRAMNGQPFFEGDTTNDFKIEKGKTTRDEVLQLLETDLDDKASFVKMGEEHIDAIKKPVGAGSANFDTYNVSYNKEGNAVYKLANKVPSVPVETVTGNLINPYPESAESRGELVGKTVASYKAGGELTRVEGKNIPVAPAAKPIESAPTPKMDKNPTPNNDPEAVSFEVPENFVPAYQAMAKQVSAEMLSSFDFRGGAGALLNARIEQHFVDETKPYIIFAQSDKPVEMNEDDSIKIQQLFKAAKEFNAQDSNWKNDFYKAVIPSDDKEMDLVRLVGDYRTAPILANGGNAFMVWDASQTKHIMVYDKNHTFRMEGNSLIMLQDGTEVGKFDYGEPMIERLKKLPI